MKKPVLFRKLGWGKTKIKHQMYAVYAIGLFIPLLIVGAFLIFSANRMLNDHYLQLLETGRLRAIFIAPTEGGWDSSYCSKVYGF